MTKRLITILSAFLLLSCGTRTGGLSSAPGGSKVDIERPARIRAAFDGYTIDDVARFLGTRPEKLPAGFQQHTADARYRKVQSQLDEAWTRYESTHLAPMRKWRSRLAGLASADIFYPFGGPDATHPTTLFPDAKRFTLIGLEPFGQVPDPLSVSPATAGAQVTSIHQAMRFVLGVNFFRTNSMKVQVGSRPYNGIVSILLLFLARMDMEIVDAFPVALKADGTLVPADEAQTRATGVRILFRRPEGGGLREMNYLQANIADGGIQGNPALRKFLNDRNQVTTMLKAASYLLHNASFSTIRTTILDRSALILSDPSGMPFRYLNNGKWELTGYGRYIRPIPLFRARYEADRYRYFARTKTEALPFAYGYHPTYYSIVLARPKTAGQ